MLEQIFKAIIITSCIGTVFAFILTLLKPITKKIFSSSWHYYMWLAVLLVMVLPIRLPVPPAPAQGDTAASAVFHEATALPDSVQSAELSEIQAENITPEPILPKATQRNYTIKSLIYNNIDTISLIWLMGMAGLLLIKVITYCVFLLKIKANSKIVDCPELKAYTGRNIVTKVSNAICSPLIVGVIKPTLMLPETEMTSEQLHNVLSHEVTHLKRNDILYKWFVTVVKCIHWFNPVIYLIGRQINIECEISCDLAVVRNMNKEEEKEYVNTILSLLSAKSLKVNSLTTGMTGSKKTLKRRFTMIKNRKKFNRKAVAISAVTAVVVLAGAVLVSGLLNGMFFRGQQEDESIKITNNGELIVFENKPFIQNEMVYVPLEEFIIKVNPNNRVEKNGDKYTIYVEKASESYTVKADSKEIYYSGQGGALRETKYAPVLKDGMIYIPYEYAEYILIDGNGYNIGGSTRYSNEKMNIQFEIPINWCGKYIVDETYADEYRLAFKHKATAEKYEGAGGLFTVYKLADAEVDEHLRVYGNSTVVWRNAEYAYVVGRPTDVQHPIWADRDKEDIDIAEEYEKLYAGITHIEETFKLIDESAESKMPIIENAENMSYAEIRDLQRMVDEGHFPWRLDYEQVIMAFVSGQGEDVENGKIIALAGGGQGCSATYLVNGNTYIVELFKPVKNNDDGIWIVRSYEKVDTAIIKEVSFYNINPNYNTLDGEIVKQENGWYRFTSDTCMFINFEGIRPDSVSVYFTPTGTNMEQYKKQIGYANPPFPQIPISVNLNFSDDDTMGHLQFVFNYEDGTSIESELYNVYLE